MSGPRLRHGRLQQQSLTVPWTVLASQLHRLEFLLGGCLACYDIFFWFAIIYLLLSTDSQRRKETEPQGQQLQSSFSGTGYMWLASPGSNGFGSHGNDP